MDLFDSHAHYDDKQFNSDRDQLINSLPQSGITNVINVGCDIASSENSVELAKQYPFFYCAVGIHPHEAANVDGNYIDQLTALSAYEKCVAIGEIGLDYHYDFSPRKIQQRVFRRQMQLAQELNMPVVIHSREATQDTLAILNEFPLVKGVMHCFGGSAETSRIIVNMGYYIGFTGVITFQNARKTIEAVAATPLDRLLLETDCPYMAPTPYRGKRCDSSMMVETAKKMAEIKNVTPQKIADITRKNTLSCFSITL